MFSVWQRPQVVWGGGDEGGSGGGGSDKTYNSLSEAARDGQHGKAVNIKGKGRQKVEFADKSYDKKMSTASSKASTGGSSGGYTSLADMFDGGGPGKSGATFGSGGGGRADTNNDGYVSAAEARANPLDQNIFSAVGNYARSGGMLGAIMGGLSGGGGGSSAPRPPRQRIGTKGMTSAQRTALTDAGYEVTKGGSVKKNGGTVAGSNFSGSREVDAIMNSGSLSGEASSFGDAFAEARRKAGGDGGTFTFGGKQFTTNIDRSPKVVRPKLRPDTVAPAAAPIVDYDRLAEQYGAYGAGRASPQAANFYTDPSASTAAVYPQAPDFSRTDLPPGSYEVASIGNPFEKFLNSVGLLEDKNTGEVSTTYNRTDGPIGDIIPDLGSDPSDNREPRGMYDSPSIVLPDELIGAPMGYVPEPMTYQEILEGADAEIIPEARTAPLSDYDADRLKPGFSQPLQARIDTPEEDAIERARLQARVGAGIGNISPEVERNAASDVRLQNLRRYVNQQRDPEPPGLSYDELVAAGLAQGVDITSRAVQDATNVIAPPDMLDDGADFIGPFRPGMEPKAGVPMVVGQQSKVATEAAIAAEGASNVFNRVKNNMDRDTRAAIERRIFPDGIGSFDSEAAKAQFVMQGASMFPVVAAMVANPGLGMTVGGGMTIADVGQQIDANVDARNQAGELGQLNPSQVQAIKLLAREKAALPSAVVGGTAARLLGTNPIAGIVADVISEVGLEPSIAEGAAFFQTGTDVKTENLLAQNPADVAFLSGLTSGAIAPAAVAGQAMNTASAPPVVQTEAPTQDSLAYKAGQGIANFTPPKAFSDAATLTATTMGGTPRMPSAVAPDAAAKVISGSGSNVAPAPVVGTKAPVQTLPENLSGLGQQGGISSLLASSGLTPRPSMVSPTALSVGNNAQYTTPSFVPDGTAALQAATIEDTGTGVTVDAPTPLTPEQIANVSSQAGAELDAALDVAPTTAVDAAPTVNLADVAANKGTALQGAAAEVDSFGGESDNNRHDYMIGATVEKGEVVGAKPNALGGKSGSQVYGDVVRSLQGKDTITREEIMDMLPTMSDNHAGQVLYALKEFGGVIGGKDKDGVYRVSQSAVAKEIGVPYENPNKIVMRTPKPDSSVGAMDNRLRSALTQELLRRDPNTDAPFNEFFYDQLNQKLKDTDQNLSALPPDPRALELAQLNRDGPLQTGGVPRTYPTTGIDSLSPLANQLYTPEQRANMQRDRQIANAQREKARLEAEAMRPLETAQNAILNSQSNVSAAENEVALANQLATQMEQLQAVNEVIAAGKTPFPVNLPATPEFTTPQTKAQLAALTTPVEAPAMAPLVPPASPESVGEADITPPTLAEFIEIQRAKPRDGVPVDPLAALVEMPPSQQEQLALDLQGGSAVATPEGIMSLVDRTSKAPAPVDAVNPVASPEISFEEAMAKVAEAPTARAPKDADPLVLTDPVTQGGITTALPGRIPKDKLTTRFESNLPVDSPFSRENQLARYAERRARFAAQENELAAAQGLTPASKPVGSTEVISRTDEEIARDNQIEQDRRNARNAALRGLASIPATRTTIVDEPRDLIEEQTLPDELLTEPFNNTPPEDTGGEGTGTPRESAPKYVPVDMNNENNDALGCPSGYARVFDPATGQPICGRIDEPSVAESSDPAEEAEEDGVVIDIPATERPKISPYYVPEMIESNYTPYVPGRRARIFKDVAVRD